MKILFDKTRILRSVALLVALLTILTSCAQLEAILGDFLPFGTSAGSTVPNLPESDAEIPAIPDVQFTYKDIPEYTGEAYVAINGNKPYFSLSEYTILSYEYYSELDSLGRCGLTVASIGKDLMPTEDREEIGSVKPSGWQSVKYDFISGKYLYNRCHLIGFQLCGENANDKNLITGTRYLNIEGMLPFENMVADYVKETGNHVLYRVLPIYFENDLVARGVLMEGYSVEDNGEGICFNVFAYNVQPGVTIDYKTGLSAESGEEIPSVTTQSPSVNVYPDEGDYVLNESSKRIHIPTCSSVANISEANKKEYTGSRSALIGEGYKACGSCLPNG